MLLKRIAAAAACAILFFPTVIFAESSEPLPPVSPAGQESWIYLDENPAGPQSIVAYSLGGRDVKENARQMLDITLESGMKDGFTSALELEYSILGLIKLGENPSSYNRTDLMSMLYGYDNIFREGLESALYALISYDAANTQIPASARNSASAVIDYVVSSQQRSGGFAIASGREPDVKTTAQAVLALSPHIDIPYVNASLDKALSWLSAQQNADGTFSLQATPDCEATALVLTAIRTAGVACDDQRFVKNGRTLTDALSAFAAGGGYSPEPGGEADVAATEAAIIALYTNETGLSPYLPPQAYPNYTAPKTDVKGVFIRFLFGFLGILLVLYLILILTTKIGKRWGKFPESKSQADKATHDTQTLEINIPMKAELPNFDTLPSDTIYTHSPADPPKS